MINVGDTVRVKNNVKDPDFGELNLDGWTGVVSDFDSEEVSGSPIVGIEWDTYTLQKMPTSHIKACVSEGWDYFGIYLKEEDIERTEKTESLEQLVITQELFFKVYGVGEVDWATDRWLGMGEQGLRIRKILWGIEMGHFYKEANAWYQFLKRQITLPFKAKVDRKHFSSAFQGGDELLVLGVLPCESDEFGTHIELMAYISFKGHLSYFPLKDLSVLPRNQNNTYVELIEDYKRWFLNNQAY